MTKEKTQLERLYEYLCEYGSINPLQAWTELGIYRLSVQIYTLRKMGFEIDTEREYAFNKFGEPVKFAKYIWLGDMNDDEED